MNRIIVILILLSLMALPVRGLEIKAPEVPDFAEDLMPSSTDSLGAGLWEVLKNALMRIRPDLKDAARICMGILAMTMLLSVLRTFSGGKENLYDLAGAICISVLLMNTSSSMIRLGARVVTQIGDYGRLLIPVMSTALAAQGAITTSGALYTGTVLFDSLLSSLVGKILVPMLYLFLALSVGASATGESMLSRLKSHMKWLMTWCLKIILYVFTGYIGITGVVSGSTDAAALKATKLTISGLIPVVGGILSDASEAVLVSANLVKNAAGLYGLIAVAAMWIGPFLRIGTHYLMLKETGGICAAFGGKSTTELIDSFCTGFGLLLGMIGSVCLMLMISTVCFMRASI